MWIVEPVTPAAYPPPTDRRLSRGGKEAPSHAEGRRASRRRTRWMGVLLDEIAREGARRMLVAALETEVAAYLEAHRDERDAEGHAMVVRNGKGRTRKVTVGAGTIPVSAPRVNDRRMTGTAAGRSRAASCRPTCAAPRRWPRCCRCSTCAAFPRATSARRSRRSRGRCGRVVRHKHRAADQRVGGRVPYLPAAQPTALRSVSFSVRRSPIQGICPQRIVEGSLDRGWRGCHIRRPSRLSWHPELGHEKSSGFRSWIEAQLAP